jgi:hypothetical protein
MDAENMVYRIYRSMESFKSTLNVFYEKLEAFGGLSSLGRCFTTRDNLDEIYYYLFGLYEIIFVMNNFRLTH